MNDQYDQIRELMREIIAKYPNGAIHGHILIAWDWRRSGFGVFENRRWDRRKGRGTQLCTIGKSHMEIFEGICSRAEWIEDLIALANDRKN